VTLLTLFSTAAASNSISVGLPVDFALGVHPRPEYVYVATEALNNETTEVLQESIHKYRIASASVAANGQTRLRTLIGVSGGIVRVQGSTGWVAFDDATDPQLDADATYYWIVEVEGLVFIGDGVDQVVYDPKKATLETFEAKTAGEVPEKCRLATRYRDRMVLAEGPRWYMSESGDPFNWEYFPSVNTATQPVADSTIERFTGDLIQTLIPGQDDYLIFGCSSSILLMRGDPADGGQIDLISDTIGMAFGNSWARDPSGTIYFFSNRGAVYRMSPGQLPQSLSDATGDQDVTVQSAFESISLNDYRMELEWDYLREGLRVFQIAYDETSTELVRSWFWSQKMNAWWPDRPGSSDLLALSAWAGDGDLPTDRVLLVGCRDGFVRNLDSLAASDDEVAIDAFVTIGPLRAADGDDQEVSMNRMRAILSAEQDGCTWEVYASDTPDSLETNPTAKLVAQGSLEPGMNPRLSVRRRGAFLWLKLRNRAYNERFAVEEVGVDLEARGSRRVRA